MIKILSGTLMTNELCQILNCLVDDMMIYTSRCVGKLIY